MIRPRTNETTETSYLQALSLSAVRHVAQIQGRRTVEDLQRRLYLYHRYPYSERGAQFGTHVEEDVARAGEEFAAVAAEEGVWRRAESPSGYEGWNIFRRMGLEPKPVRDRPGTVKVYFSPTLAAFGPSLGTFLAAATETDVVAFKFGATAHYVCRPDKVVVYGRSRQDLLAFAALLASRLPEDTPAHGVSFTEQVDDHGLLSMGLDPPRGSVGLGGSWRGFVTMRLAASLHYGARLPVDDRVELALSQLRDDGVDTERWAPTSDLWVESRS